jgi:hypothetical protein
MKKMIVLTYESFMDKGKDIMISNFPEYSIVFIFESDRTTTEIILVP